MATTAYKTPSGATITLDNSTQGVVSTQNAQGAKIAVPTQSYYSPPASGAQTPATTPATPTTPVAPVIPTNPTAPVPNLQPVSTATGTSLYYNSTTGQYYADSAGSTPVNYNSSTQQVTLPNGKPYVPQTSTTGQETAVTSDISALENPTPPQTEDEIYGTLTSQLQDTIDSLTSSIDAQMSANTTNENAAGAVALQNAASLFGTSGVTGSAAKISADTANRIAADNNPLAVQKVTTVATIMQNIQSLASSQATTEASQYETSLEEGAAVGTQQNQQFLSAVQGLASHGINWAQFSTDPAYASQYQSLLQLANNDPNYAQGLFAMSTPAANVIQSWLSPDGATYYQLSQVPGSSPQVLSYQLPSKVPVGWTSVKVGTTGVMFYNPQDPSQNITYTTNPFTGQITPGSSTTAPTSDTSTSSGAPTDATTTVSQSLGVDPTTPFSKVLDTSGVGAITAALINEENTSLPESLNNPGGIKFAGLPGQTDSKIKATDGGTFASYATKQDGVQAIADIVESAASGTDPAYGENPTLADFVSTYTNTNGANSPATSTTLDPKEYGLLSNVGPGTATNFDPTQPGPDQAAWNYLNQYLTQGKTPTAASVGISTRTGSGVAFNTVAQRADQVYFAATGQHLPNITTLTSNLGLISNNNALLNNLSVQEGTISKNFGLNLENLNANNVNQVAPIINKLFDYLAQATGNTSVAQYLAQNSTIQNELGSLLAVKNANGTTVADKLAGGDLLPSDLSAAQQKQILGVLMQEANNQTQAIGQANATLYQQTDPLGIDPKNPINAPGYSEMTSLGATNNFNGSWTLPSNTTLSDGTVLPAGTILSVDANGNVTTQ